MPTVPMPTADSELLIYFDDVVSTSHTVHRPKLERIAELAKLGTAALHGPRTFDVLSHQEARLAAQEERIRKVELFCDNDTGLRSRIVKLESICEGLTNDAGLKSRVITLEGARDHLVVGFQRLELDVEKLEAIAKDRDAWKKRAEEITAHDTERFIALRAEIDAAKLGSHVSMESPPCKPWHASDVAGVNGPRCEDANGVRRCQVSRGHFGLHADEIGMWERGLPQATTPAPLVDEWYWSTSEGNFTCATGPFITREAAISDAAIMGSKPFWTGRRDPVIYTEVAPAMWDVDQGIENVNNWLCDEGGLEDPEFDIADDLKKQLEDQVYGVILKFFEEHELYAESWIVADVASHNEPMKWREILDPGHRGWPTTHGRVHGAELTKEEILGIADTRRTALVRANIADPEAVHRFDMAYVAARAELGC